MPRPLTEQERQKFLAEPHIGVVSVASDDGRPPLAVPLWYGYEPGGHLTFFTGTQGRKARKTRLIEKAGVLSLSVQREEFPYRYVTVEGIVVGIERLPSAERMSAVARRYLPEEAARQFVEAGLENPGAGLVLFAVRPAPWLTADFAGGDPMVERGTPVRAVEVLAVPRPGRETLEGTH